MIRLSRTLFAALMAIAVGWGGAASAADPTVPPQGVQQISALKALSLSRTGADTKLDSRLYWAVLGTQRDPRMAQFPDLRIMRPAADGLIAVDVVVSSASGVKPVVELIGSRGGVVKSAHHGFRNVSARVHIDDLQPLAALAQVTRVRQAIPAMRQSMQPTARDLERGVKVPSSVGRMAQSLKATHVVNVSEGDATHGAVAARALYGANGAGQKICVLSDGVDSLAAAVASGDLPAGIDVLAGQAGSGDEGTAMLEIVHDLAPGASLGFATAFTSEASFAQNILDLATAGCTIIVDDVIYLDESPFQDGPVAQSVNTVTAAGVLYFSSAGNEGNKNDTTSGTWEGDFLASGAAVPAPLAGANLHNFGDAGNSILVEFGGGNPPLLIWAENYDLATGNASTDFDLYVMNTTLTTIFDASTDVQDGSGGDDFPVEFVSGGTFANERLLIDKFAAGTTSSVPAMNLIVFRGELDNARTTAGTTRGHSAAAAAFSVAATPAAAPFAAPTPTGPFPGLYTAANALETFSADGPRRVLLSPTGVELTPGNRTISGGVVRQKPDITAADGVSTSAPGFNPFYGTSAAAPHAAAIAGLIKSAVPGITPAQVRTALISSAIDIEAPGVDRDAGAGIIMAGPALAAAGAVPQAVLTAVVAIPTQIAGDGDGVIEPNEDFALSIPLQNIGGAPASAITATLSSATPGITLYQTTSAYPNLAAAATGANATAYLFHMGSNVPCGAALNFTLTVSYTGGPSPQSFNFTLNTGAAGAPTTYTYAGAPVAIPDGIDLTGAAPGAPAAATLAVAAAGSVFDVDLRIDGATCSATAGSTTVGIDHSFINDLEITLISPSGAQVKAIQQTDGSGNNLCQTLLDDESAGASIQSVVTASAPFTGSFTPNAALSAFDGLAATGNWQLQAQDFFSADTGSIRAWSLILTPALCNAPVQPAALRATKTVAGSYLEGSTVTYTVVLTNAGTGISPDNASDEFVDVLPAALTLVSASATAGTATTAGNQVNWNGLLLPGAATTITITATINAGTAGSVVSNQASMSFDADRDGTNEATALSDDPALGGAADPTSFTVLALADLSLTLTDTPDPVAAGSNLTYVATVTNVGPSAATGVTVTLPIPANTSYVSDSVAGGGSCAVGASVVCSFTGTVLPGAGNARAATIVLAVSAAAPNASVINATATAATTASDPNLADNSASASTTVATSANLALTLVASATQTNVTLPVTFTATSTNLGPSDAQDVVVSITLSPDFRFSSLTPSAGAVCTSPQVGLSGVISCTFTGSTVVGAVRTLAVNAYSNTAGTSSIQASTSSPTTDPVLGNNAASVSVTVGAPGLPIPMLDRYGLILLGLMFAGLGLLALRRAD